MATLDELLAAKAALRDLPGWKVAAEVQGLNRSRGVFVGNVRELGRFLRSPEEPHELLQLWDMQNREGFDRYLEEVDRLLHNFVAASMSLRDHSRRLKNKLLPEDPADDLAAEYNQRVRDAFDEAPLARFVQDLRNFSLHRRIPITTGTLSVDARRNEWNSTIVLHPEDLLRWSGWTARAKAFIEASEGEIAIEDVARDYTDRVLAFHNWFRKALLARHDEDLQELRRTSEEVARRFREAFGEPFDSLHETATGSDAD
jgi:hypothetical protein